MGAAASTVSSRGGVTVSEQHLGREGRSETEPLPPRHQTQLMSALNQGRKHLKGGREKTNKLKKKSVCSREHLPCNLLTAPRLSFLKELRLLRDF